MTTYNELVKKYGKASVDRELTRLLDHMAGRERLSTHEGREALRKAIDRAKRRSVAKAGREKGEPNVK